MGAWRTRVYRCNDISTIISNFPNEVAAFGGEYIAFEQDLPVPDRDKFHSMCDQIVTMTNAEVEEQIHGVMNGLIGKERLLKRIEEIIAFTQTG
jgi:hypothetical protein